MSNQNVFNIKFAGLNKCLPRIFSVTKNPEVCTFIVFKCLIFIVSEKAYNLFRSQCWYLSAMWIFEIQNWGFNNVGFWHKHRQSSLVGHCSGGWLAVMKVQRYFHQSVLFSLFFLLVNLNPNLPAPAWAEG